MTEGEALNYLHHDFVRAPSILSVDQGMPPAAAGLKLSDRALQMGLILGRLKGSASMSKGMRRSRIIFRRLKHF